MSNFYTNVVLSGNQVLLRSVENGKKKLDRIEFQPTMYLKTKKPSELKTLFGEPVEEFKAGGIRDTRDFIKNYEGVQGFDVYGNSNYVQQFLSDNYNGSVVYDIDKIRSLAIDIETTTEEGFPDIGTANEEILLITLVDCRTYKSVCFGSKPCDWVDTDKSKYILCSDEKSLLMNFLMYWQANYPDIITGWNSDRFDMAYTINRIKRVLGGAYAKKLSPWNMLIERKVIIRGREEQIYDVSGVSSLDYLDLYEKFTYNKQESYALDFICEKELGEKKLKNPGETFKEFYTDHWDTFVRYNIRDAELVVRLNDKMRLLELVMTIAYQAKINYEDVFSPVKTWEAIIYNYLRGRNIVIPQSKFGGKSEQFEGAYVKDPLIGVHKWVASFDLNSLYPHLIMQYNMSPETIADIKIPCTVDDLLIEKIDTSVIEPYNVSMTANGWCYSKEKKGFLPQLMEDMYSDRSKAKKQMLKCEQDLEYDKGNFEIEKEISRLNNLQMALKILLNSAYGALGNNYFKYFDLRLAEGITTSGQLSIRWMANRLNSFMNKTLKTTDKDYVIAIDTDSIYLTLEDLVEKTCEGKSIEAKIKYMDKICEEVFQPFINEGYKKLADYMYAYDQKMIMKRESLADKGIFIAKKRYILNVHNSEGVQYKTPKLKVMGLEMVRSSTPGVCRSKLKDAIPVILDGDSAGLKQYVSDFKQEFMALPVQDIAKPSGVNGMITYKGTDGIYAKGTPIHVRGCLLFNHHVNRLGLSKKYELIQDGDKIKFVYVRKPNPFQEDVISFATILPPEFGLDDFIDRDLQFQKVFVDALQIMVNPLGWNLDDSANLEDFFG